MKIFILIIYSGSQDVLDTILGPLEEPKKVEKKKDVVPPPKLKLGSPVMVTKPKEEKKKVEEEKPAPIEVCILFQSYSQYKCFFHFIKSPELIFHIFK